MTVPPPYILVERTSEAIKPTCATCNAFEPTAANSKSGLCRAAPPIGIPVMGQVSALSQQMVPCIQGGWPPTQAGFWCRSWQAMETSND